MNWRFWKDRKLEVRVQTLEHFIGSHERLIARLDSENRRLRGKLSDLVEAIEAGLDKDQEKRFQGRLIESGRWTRRRTRRRTPRDDYEAVKELMPESDLNETGFTDEVPWHAEPSGVPVQGNKT